MYSAKQLKSGAYMHNLKCTIRQRQLMMYFKNGDNDKKYVVSMTNTYPPYKETARFVTTRFSEALAYFKGWAKDYGLDNKESYL